MPETHAIPLAIQAALSENGTFTVYGVDFDTRDGSAVRDYIHVSDLARAHVLAADRLLTQSQYDVFNLGTGNGTTVLEIATAVNAATNGRLTLRHSARRAGDPASLVASAAKAEAVLGWKPEQSEIIQIVQSALHWQKRLGTSINLLP